MIQEIDEGDKSGLQTKGHCNDRWWHSNQNLGKSNLTLCEKIIQHASVYTAGSTAEDVSKNFTVIKKEKARGRWTIGTSKQT